MNLNSPASEEVFVFPPSFAQQRLWFLHQLAPENPFYNVSAGLCLKGNLSLSALEKTFNEIVRRHETLRTNFAMMDGELMQVIAPSLSIPLPVIDLSHIPSAKREAEARQQAQQEAKRPFNLTNDPLLRLKLLKIQESEFILLLNFHHIVADGWSMSIFIRELSILYTSIIENTPSPLPELPIQYADFAEWQHQWLQGVLESQLAYWRQKLEGISTLNLPTDKPRPSISSYSGASYPFTISPSLSQGLEALSQEKGVTLFMTLLTAFKILLYRYTQQEDIAVGFPIANRNRQEIEGLIGFFVNSLVLRTNLQGNPSFSELLAQVKQETLAAYAHQDLPFEKLVEVLGVERDISRNPLFQVSFTLQNTPVEKLQLPGLSLELWEVETETAKLDLEFHLWQGEGMPLQGKVIYSTDLFESETITQMVACFQTLLEGVIANPQQKINTLPLFQSGEWQSFEANKDERERDCFISLFESYAKKDPDKIALYFEGLTLTYRELNNQANQLSHYLQKSGVVADTLVGIYLERSFEMIVALLGILKAGGAYLPLDTTYPRKRLQFMLEDAQPLIILTQSYLESKINTISGQSSIVCLDKVENTIAQENINNSSHKITPNNLAYVIYTSGSMGKPKGVLIEHRGLSNLIAAQREAFSLQTCDRILQFSSLSFDASIFEIVMALAGGATLYLAKQETLLPGEELIQFLRHHAITHTTLPPAVLAVLPFAKLPALHTLITAGEACTPEIVRKWAQNRHFFNAYGLTEATVWSTIAQIHFTQEQVSIGRPILNTSVYILDKNFQPVPMGVTGEIYIGGEGLARGYLNRSELTAERFIPHPVIVGDRLYKTGDKGRYLPNGTIKYLGRIDTQVKIRGFRIELGEIEAALRQHEAVKEAVVIAREDYIGDKRLVAYIVTDSSIQSNSLHLRQFLQRRLPSYMLPSAIVFLEALPLTSNGKVNRRILPKPTETRQLEAKENAPRNHIEKAIANIFRQILSLDSVGIDDNFFSLGGNSLLAIRLITEVNQQLQTNLSLSNFFLHPTIAEIASQLSRYPDDLKESPLVAIQPQGKNLPFFCIHPIFGVIFPYYELAFSLGKNQPFYGVQPLGLNGKTKPLTRLEEIAAYYIQEMQRVQPYEPYCIGGWSFGGLVAFEMAQQLLKAGKEVSLLAMLDTAAPLATLQPSLGESLRFLLTTAMPDILPFTIDYLRLMRQKFTQSLRQKILDESALLPILRVYQANSQAALSYTPQNYAGRVTLFKSNQKGTIAHRDFTMGWDTLAMQGVDVRRIPGNHLTMLRKPNVSVLAKELQRSMKDYAR